MQNVGHAGGKKHPQNRVSTNLKNNNINSSSNSGSSCSNNPSSITTTATKCNNGRQAVAPSTAAATVTTATTTTTTTGAAGVEVGATTTTSNNTKFQPRVTESSESDEESVSEVDSFPIDRTFEIESEGENDEDDEEADESDDEGESDDDDDEDCEDDDEECEDDDDDDDLDEECDEDDEDCCDEAEGGIVVDGNSDNNGGTIGANAEAVGGGGGVTGSGTVGVGGCTNPNSNNGISNSVYGSNGNGGGNNNNGGLAKYSKKFMLNEERTGENVPSQSHNTKARLEALLEAADEAAQALNRMRSDNSPRDKNLLSRSLIDACTDNDVNAVRRLLGEGNNAINDGTDDGESLLSLACSAGYYELAQVLLAMSAQVEDRGQKNDCTPLMEAASAGHVDIIRLLISHGADVNAQSSTGNTPLMYACAAGYVDAVQELLENNAHVEDHNENGHTPLMEAASAGHVDVAKILLEHGAGINTHSNEFKESALTLACYKGHLEMVRFLLDAGADQEHKTDEMHTALMEASMDGHVEVAKLLLDSGAQVNMPTDSFESPLTLAACGGHTQLALLLIERGANIEEVNDESYTPLMEAAREGHEEMVSLLLAKGANINCQTEETQETALTLACCGGFLEVAAYLIRQGADIELGASTPLMEAAQEGHIDLVKYLLEIGADVHAQTQTGDTALTYACENGHTDVAEVLLGYGAKLEHESEGGRTPLMKACRAGHNCTVKFLINRGAMVNRNTTNNDHTPLSLACAGGHQTVVELLLKSGADPFYRLKDNSTMLIEAAKGGHIGVVQLLLDYPLSLFSVQPLTTPGAEAANVVNNQISLIQSPHDMQQLSQSMQPLTMQQQQQQMNVQQQQLAQLQQQQLAQLQQQQQQQQLLAAPPGLQDVPEAVRVNNHQQMLRNDHMPDSNYILQNFPALAGIKDGFTLGLGKSQPEMVNQLINNLNNSFLQQQQQQQQQQQSQQIRQPTPVLLDTNQVAAVANNNNLSGGAPMVANNNVPGPNKQKSVARRSSKGGGIQQPTANDNRSMLNISTAEAQQTRAEPLGEDENMIYITSNYDLQSQPQQPPLPPSLSGTEADTEKVKREYQYANFQNSKYKLSCDGTVSTDMCAADNESQYDDKGDALSQPMLNIVDYAEGNVAVGMYSGSHQAPVTESNNMASNVTSVPLPPPQKQSQQNQILAPSEVSQDTAISDRPKVKPVSKKDSKNALRKLLVAALNPTNNNQTQPLTNASQNETSDSATTATTNTTNNSNASDVVAKVSQKDLLRMVQKRRQQFPAQPLPQMQQDQWFVKQVAHDVGINIQPLLQMKQQNQLQQHETSGQDGDGNMGSDTAIGLYEMTDAVLAAARCDYAAILERLEQQQLREQILEQQRILECHSAASVDAEANAITSEVNEEGGISSIDTESQTQNVSSSSESDEQINSQWNQKMWQMVAQSPNHPLQKIAQRLIADQPKSANGDGGEENPVFDNDALSARHISEMVSVICAVCSDVPLSYIPAFVQEQGKSQKLVADIKAMQQLLKVKQMDQGQSFDTDLDHQLHMFALEDSDPETIPDCEIYPAIEDGLGGEVGRNDGSNNLLSTTMDEDSKESNNKSELDYYILGAISALGVPDLPLPLQNDPNMTRPETADLFANIIASHASHLDPAQQQQLFQAPGATLQSLQQHQQEQGLLTNVDGLSDDPNTEFIREMHNTYVDKFKQEIQSQPTISELAHILALQEQQHFNMVPNQIDPNNPNCRFSGQQFQQPMLQQPHQQQQSQQQPLLTDLVAGGTNNLTVLQPHQLLPKTDLQQQQQQQPCYQHSQATQTKGMVGMPGSESPATCLKRGAGSITANAGNGGTSKLERLQNTNMCCDQKMTTAAQNAAYVQQNQVMNAGQMPPSQVQGTKKGGEKLSRKEKRCLGNGRHAPATTANQPGYNFDAMNTYGQPYPVSTAATATVGTTANEKTIDVDSETDSNHDTALTLACAGGHEELVELLISRGANIEHRDKKGFTPLILAATAGHVKVVEVLLKFGADMEAQSERTKDTPLSLACSGGRYEVVELLLNVGANKEHRNVSDYTPLSLAASGGYVNIIKFLLAKGAEINSRTGSKLGISPLMLAAMNGHTPAVKLLLDMGSDINAQIETNRNTALTLACFQGRHEVVSLLLDRKANVEHRAKTGLTPLMEAASGGYIEVGRVLLDKGADVNAAPVPSSRDTALTIAADKGHLKFVELLLNRFAAVEVKNKKGNSPLWLAANGGHLTVVEILYNHEADIDSQDNRKVSCLMAAFRKGHTKVVKWMVNHVTQFPSDQEMTRYISTVSDKEMLEKCKECVRVIRAAKEAQDVKAFMNASNLLEELHLEKAREESRKAAAARRREKKKKKKLEKKEEKRKMTETKPTNAGQQQADDEDGSDAEEEDDDVPEMNPVEIHGGDKEEGDSGIDANSQGSCSSTEVKTGSAGKATAENEKQSKAKAKKKEKAKEKEKLAIAEKQSVQQKKKDDDTPAVVSTKKASKEQNEKRIDKSSVKGAQDVKNNKINEKENVMPKEEQPVVAKGGNKATKAESNKKAEQASVRMGNEEKKEVLSHNNQIKPANVKSSAKVEDVTFPTKSSAKQQQPHQQQQQPIKKGEEGWKEVVRKSSVQQQQQPAAQTELNCKKIQVPVHAISRVIGRAGSNINAIRASTGAHIEVEKQGKSQCDRLITIKGNVEATRQAHQLIATLIKDPDVDILTMMPKANTPVPSSTPKPLNVPTGVSVWGNLFGIPKIEPASANTQGATNPATGSPKPPSGSAPNKGVANVSSSINTHQIHHPQATPNAFNSGSVASKSVSSFNSTGIGGVKPSVAANVKASAAVPPQVSQSQQSHVITSQQQSARSSDYGNSSSSSSSGHRSTVQGSKMISTSSSSSTASVSAHHQSSVKTTVYADAKSSSRTRTTMSSSCRTVVSSQTTIKSSSAHSGSNKSLNNVSGPPPGSFAAKLTGSEQNSGNMAGSGAGTTASSAAVGSSGNSQKQNVLMSPGKHNYQQIQQMQSTHHHSNTSSGLLTNLSKPPPPPFLLNNNNNNNNSNNGHMNRNAPFSQSQSIGSTSVASASSSVLDNTHSMSTSGNYNVLQMINNHSSGIVSPSSNSLLSSPSISGLAAELNMMTLASVGGAQLQIQGNPQGAHGYSLFNEPPQWESAKSKVIMDNTLLPEKVDVTKAPGYRGTTMSSPVSSKASSSQSVTPPSSAANISTGPVSAGTGPVPASVTSSAAQSTLSPVVSGVGASMNSNQNQQPIGVRQRYSLAGSGVPSAPPNSKHPQVAGPGQSGGGGSMSSASTGNYFDAHNLMGYGQQPPNVDGQMSYGHHMGPMQASRLNPGATPFPTGGPGPHPTGGRQQAPNKNAGPPPPNGAVVGPPGNNMYANVPNSGQPPQTLINQFSKMNNPYNQHRMGGSSGQPPPPPQQQQQQQQNTRWYDIGSGMANGLGLGLGGSPSAMSPNNSQQHVNGVVGGGNNVGGAVNVPPGGGTGSILAAAASGGDDERKMPRPIGTERASWKYGYGQGPMSNMGPGQHGGPQLPLEADQMNLWMQLEKSGAAGGGGGLQQQVANWMTHSNNSVGNNVNRQPPLFMQNVDPDLQLPDPYNMQMDYLQSHASYLPQAYHMPFSHTPDMQAPPSLIASHQPQPDKVAEQWSDHHDKHCWPTKWSN